MVYKHDHYGVCKLNIEKKNRDVRNTLLKNSNYERLIYSLNPSLVVTFILEDDSKWKTFKIVLFIAHSSHTETNTYKVFK